MVTLGSLLSKLLNHKADPKTPVKDILYSQFKQISLETPLGKLSRILHRDHFALVVHKQRSCKNSERKFDIMCLLRSFFVLFRFSFCFFSLICLL